ncbi:MAG: hypothetical protein IPF85_07005 [Anaerolineae bacterium]|nr:hypothetical protein [Anaerolineae bacterium]
MRTRRVREVASVGVLGISLWVLAVLVLTLSACRAMPRPPRVTPVPPSAELRPTAQVGPSPQPADESTPTAAVDLTPLQHLPIGLAVNPATVAGLAPLLQAQDIIKVTAANVGLAAQAGQAQCALHLPRLDAYTPDELLAVVPQADLDRCAFFTLSIEAHALPEADVPDPSAFLGRVRTLADHFGKKLMVAAPAYRFVDNLGNIGGRRNLKPGSGVDAARYADILIVEAQKSVDDPASFASLLRQARPAAQAINPAVQVWAMIGCAEDRCSDSVDAFVTALVPLATELDGIWIFYPPADPTLAQDFVKLMGRGG